MKNRTPLTTETQRHGEKRALVAVGKLLPRSFFNRDPRVVARELLGKLVVRRESGEVLSGRIVETEAYLGADDLAAHAAAGQTARNAVLFGPAGHVYVYFIYGMYYCLNFSCLPDGEAGGVLIRALEPVAGLVAMARARGLKSFNAESLRDRRALTSGPGRLCDALGITRARDNAKDATSTRSDLQVRDDGFHAGRVLATPRIGIVKSAELPLRYIVAGSKFLSRN
ncbi:MAG TPA: DNA-3-methyladenine glycosylase [Candidatus Angelobacter sp.]|nr:DNA-3-methyladenine glycosylase [Candidatus Angelobacter sp.]